MNQENLIDPGLLDLFENYFNQRLSESEAREFETKLSSDKDLKMSYEAFLQSRAAVNQKIEANLRQDLKKWQTNNTRKPETKIFTLYRWRAAIAATVVGLVSLTAIQNYNLNQFIDKKIEANPIIDLASRSDDQNRVEKIVSDNNNDLPKQRLELSKISELDPEYKNAQKWLAQYELLEGDCENVKIHLTTAESNQEEKSLAVILCHLKSNLYDEEFEKELKAILSDPTHNNYRIAADIKNKMSSIWWKLLK